MENPLFLETPMVGFFVWQKMGKTKNPAKSAKFKAAVETEDGRVVSKEEKPKPVRDLKQGSFDEDHFYTYLYIYNI